MKLKTVLTTSTALLGLGAAAALADSNTSVAVQTGNDNSLMVIQDGAANVAGQNAATNGVLRQLGNDNTMSVSQTGNQNKVATTWPADSNRGAHQTGNHNTLTVTQVSRDISQSQNGNQINTIRQTSSGAASSDTNIAVIEQGLGEFAGVGDVAKHLINRVDQTHTGGLANTLAITQHGGYSLWFGNGQNNQLDRAYQNGSNNSATIVQKGDGPVVTTSGQQKRGPANLIGAVWQQGSDNGAEVLQNGFQNYIGDVRQVGGGNTATVSLSGDFNGATPSAGNGHPASGVLTAAGAAAAAAAMGDALAGLTAGRASSVEQVGSGNTVQYTVTANGNQFGFWQYGSGNIAENIEITGDSNQVAVYQSGTDNRLNLASIAGMDNLMGLIQGGTGNVASVAISGSANMGYHGFDALGTAGILASAEGLAPGLMEQWGAGNQLNLTVLGSDNVFASRQGSESAPGTNNIITGRQDGSGGNQAAVVQAGTDNVVNFSQTGASNYASIQQGL